MLKNGVKIATINGAEVLKIKTGEEGEIKYNAVFSNSLLLDKLKDIGLEISKQGSTKDIINVAFDYGYTDEETKEMIKEYNINKANNKAFKKDNKETTNRIKALNSMLEKANKKINELNKSLQDAEEKMIDKINSKINTQEKKIEKYETELQGLDITVIDIIENNNNNIKKQNKEIANKIYSKDKLRDLLYNEGFSLPIYRTEKGERKRDKTIDYVYWFRSAGKAKQGTDYFINKELFNKIDEWQRMGIKLPDKKAKLIEMEVYKTMIASALVSKNQYITIKPEEILVMKDLKCYSDPQDVIKIIRDENTGHSKAIHTKDRCENTIWDGMCLLQKNDEIGLSEGFRGLRHHFYKSAGFVSDFQQYFKDYYKEDYETATIIDMFGREVKVSTIKMLTTNNALKWIKLIGDTKESFELWSEYVRENGCKFGIVKENHESKYDSKQRMSYQMLQTLDINKEDFNNVFNDSLDYIMKLKNDNEFFINHLRRTATTVNNNALLVDLVTTYPTFINSYMFKDARRVEINQYKETLKRGKLLTEGENETLCPNPLLLCKYCTGEINDYIHDGVITVNSKGEKLIDETLPKKNSCYCLRFKNEEQIGAMRSPHNSMNNIMLFENYINEEMNKYFDYFGKNVIAINTLYNDVEMRGNGLDFDLDFVYCTTNKTVLEAVKKAQKFPTIINGFKENPSEYNNTSHDLAVVDSILQSSQKAIGTSSNVAQLYLTQYWHKIHEIDSFNLDNSLGDIDSEYIDYLKSKCDDMLDNVCILSVLAQCAVDASKRIYTVGVGENGLNREINRIRRELPFKAKPMFWQYTSETFKNEEIEKKLKNRDKEEWKKLSKEEQKKAVKEEKNLMISKLYDYECPFDWLLKEIATIPDAEDTKRIKDVNFLVTYGDKKTQDRKQAKKIEELVQQFQDACNFLNATENDEDEEETNKYYSMLYAEYLDKVSTLSLDLDTMSLMIRRTLDKDNKFLKSNKKIKIKLLNILYNRNDGKYRGDFMKCFKDYGSK